MNAYLTDYKSTVNKTVIGSVESKIVETFDPPEKIEKGSKITKIVQVKNTGIAPCYVRIWLGFTDEDWKSKCQFNFNTADWTAADSEGFYYYKKPLASGASTTALFKTVTVSGDNLPSTNLQIIVYEDSVQTSGSSSYTDFFNKIR